MIALSVNLNKIALIRNSREGNYPDVVAHGRVCLEAGAQGLTVHPRPDQRHIRPDDVRALAELCRSREEAEFNVEGNPFASPLKDYPGLMPLVLETKPDQCTLVPDSNDQLTSDHGFDLERDGARLEPLIAQLKDANIRVSLFMDPEPSQIKLAKEVGADRIELYTGPYAEAVKHQSDELESIFAAHCAAAEQACQLGLGVNAGHDLNLINLPRYRTLPGLQEVSIGHALTVDAISMGLENAVTAYLNCLAGN
ncbi:pyridoxine 5'-phosphate synthase [Microbulbifer thermotolerans]|uniref:pyridoxine 5'-phosphate synthase n=1 Tax=Microbulbifer thermotolerans TaxID=252514 RepID=UPI0008F19D75|nr:pyridoxine 5'-phosphate synthase [Microbulbifer thermotolerans]MCX2778831.1 pyridoxine 5'-phosphate synthase [Microbulbifer thermotolerans]MCX2804136.1 pyridoxine 5'-phosphate synthase [Microbulbifer thermotolerans]SFB74199.1 pyridoxine 5-phosphate synthase [Microbulbifer thermotolerans]